jgi:hypothetical protein
VEATRSWISKRCVYLGWPAGNESFREPWKLHSLRQESSCSTRRGRTLIITGCCIKSAGDGFYNAVSVCPKGDACHSRSLRTTPLGTHCHTETWTNSFVATITCTFLCNSLENRSLGASAGARRNPSLIFSLGVSRSLKVD